MHRIIAGGTGFVGQYLARKWLDEGHSVAIIGRSAPKIKKIFGDMVETIEWDDFIDDSQHLLHQAGLVVNLTGANIGEQRWSAERKQILLNSRTHYTKILAQACADLADHAPPLFNASAIGIYGLQESESAELPRAFDETCPIDFEAKPDFLAEIGRAWETKTNIAKAHGVHVINLRFGVVLGHGGVLAKLTTPFKFGLGGPIGNGRQPFSWIHIDDLAGSIEFLLQHQHIHGPVNIVSPNAVSQKQFAKSFAKSLHRPCFMPTPGFILKFLFGQMAEELLLKGQHVFPKILLDAGFKFKHPDLDEALEAIQKSKR